MNKFQNLKISIMISILVTILLLSVSQINAVPSATTTSTSSSSTNSNGCNLVFTLVNQDPSPAVANDYVKVLIQVSGVDNFNCKNGVAVKLVPEYPFSLDPGVNPIQTIDGPTYNSQGYLSDWMIPYKLRVANDALEGDYDLKLLYHIGSGSDFSTSSVEKDFNISVTDAQTDFSTVIQDSSGTQVSFGIVNTGKNTANSLIVGIPSQESYRATGTSQQIVGNLAAGDYTIVSFNIASTAGMRNRNFTRGDNSSNATVAGQNFNPQSQTIKIQMDYTDAIGKRRSVVKEVQYSQAAGGNLTRGNFQGRTSSSSSTFSFATVISYITTYWYVSLLVVLIILWILWKFVIKKHTKHEKNSGKTPDWVESERIRKK